MNADQFKAINADLPTELSGITFHFEPMPDEKGFFLLLEIPLEVNRSDIVRAAPLAQKWQERIRAQYDPAKAYVIETWALRIARKEITYAKLSRHLLAELTKAAYEMHETEMHETGMRAAAFSILFKWGYSIKKAFEILDLAAERIKEDKPPFENPPIDPDRVRNQINRWKRQQNKRA